MIIVDASVALKWLVLEDPPELINKSRALLSQFLAGKEQLSAPDILLYELGNVLSHKTSLNIHDINSAWDIFKSIDLPTIRVDTVTIKKAIALSSKYQVSVYDAAYVVLAVDKNALLLTCDKKFIKAVNLPFVKDLADY